MTARNHKRDERLGIANGAGPICVFCFNAKADLRANPDTFDIAAHVEKCRQRAEKYRRQTKELSA